MAKIIIVDDNKDIVDTLNSIMKRMGYKTELAYDGKEFLDKVEKVKPDLVLLDVMMPGPTTKEILEKLKKMGLSNLKVILVTVVRFSNDERDLLMKEYKVVDYITKPFSVPDLMDRVKKQLAGGEIW
jgi:CheY-like chemotaxis protein